MNVFCGQLEESAKTTISFLTNYGNGKKRVYRGKRNKNKEDRKRRRRRKRRRKRKKREGDRER